MRNTSVELKVGCTPAALPTKLVLVLNSMLLVSFHILFGWLWLVLIYCDRKIVLVDWWLLLIWCVREKILVGSKTERQ